MKQIQYLEMYAAAADRVLSSINGDYLIPIHEATDPVEVVEVNHFHDKVTEFMDTQVFQTRLAAALGVPARILFPPKSDVLVSVGDAVRLGETIHRAMESSQSRPLFPFIPRTIVEDIMRPASAEELSALDLPPPSWSFELSEPGFAQPVMPYPSQNPCREIWVGNDLCRPSTTVVDLSRFPHACPRCGQAAYVGFASVDCSAGCH